MKYYSVSEAARQLGVERATLYRWIKEKCIPSPTAQIIAGARLTYWTEREMTELKRYKDKTYWGKGMDRRKGKRSKQKKRSSQ